MKEPIEIWKGLREDKDLKQSDIAALIGTTQQQYSKYEKGESELPVRALTAMADFYSVSTDYLMGRTECREGVDGQNKMVTPDCTVGRLVSEILALGKQSRASVVEYVGLQKMKESSAKK